MPDDHDPLYDEAFYAAQAPGSARSAAIALGQLFRWVRPRRVVDVGCGVGTWLETAQRLGAIGIVGFDGDHVKRETLVIPTQCFIPARLDREDPAALLPEGQGRFDLVMSLEVAEHLPHERSAAFVAGLAALGDLVLFSAALPFQNGTGHVNEQWAEFWAILFRAQGFACFDPLRPLLRASPEVDWWYAQNILLFARRGSAAEACLPPESRADRQPLSLVHPYNLLMQTLWNFRSHRVSARHVEEADYARIVAAWCGEATSPPVLEAVRLGQGGGDDQFPATRMTLGDPETANRLAAERIDALQRRCDIAERQAGELRRALALLRPQNTA